MAYRIIGVPLSVHSKMRCCIFSRALPLLEGAYQNLNTFKEEKWKNTAWSGTKRTTPNYLLSTLGVLRQHEQKVTAVY